MSDVYVIGADLIKFGRYPDHTPAQLGAQAALLALDDAGLTVHDLDVVYASSTYNAASMIGQQVLKQIGQTGVPCVNVSNACASGATALVWKRIPRDCSDRRPEPDLRPKACSVQVRRPPCLRRQAWSIRRLMARR